MTQKGFIFAGLFCNQNLAIYFCMASTHLEFKVRPKEYLREEYLRDSQVHEEDLKDSQVHDV